MESRGEQMEGLGGRSVEGIFGDEFSALATLYLLSLHAKDAGSFFASLGSEMLVDILVPRGRPDEVPFKAAMAFKYGESGLVLVPVPAPLVSLAGVQEAIATHWRLLDPKKVPVAATHPDLLPPACRDFYLAHLPEGA